MTGRHRGASQCYCCCRRCPRCLAFEVGEVDWVYGSLDERPTHLIQYPPITICGSRIWHTRLNQDPFPTSVFPP